MNSYPLGLLTMAVLIALVRLVVTTLVRRVAGKADALRERMGEMLEAANREDWDTVTQLRAAIEQELPSLWGRARTACTADFWTAIGDAESARGDQAAAIEAFREVLRHCATLPASERKDRELRAELSLGLLSSSGEDGRDLLQRALDRERDASGLMTRVRLGDAALTLARHLLEQGKTEQAHLRYEQAMRIGRTFPPTQPVLFGAEAAMDLAREAIEQHKEPEARPLLEQAIEGTARVVTPEARQLRAEALLQLARSTPVDPLVGDGAHARWLEEAEAAGRDSATPIGRVIAARAALERAALLGNSGHHDEAAHAAERVMPLVAGLAPEFIGTLVSEAHALAGHAFYVAGDRVHALEELNATLESGFASTEEGSREVARVAGFRLIGILSDQRRFDEADAVLDRLADDAESFTGAARAVYEARLARARGHRAWRSGDRFEARHQLEQSLGILEPLEPAMRDAALHATARDLGMMALEDGRPEEALELLERAVATADGAHVSDAERSALLNPLGFAYLALSRLPSAIDAWRRSFESGRASGEAVGRLTAAAAAMNLAVHLEVPEEQLEWARAAQSLGKLSGLADGRRLSADARIIIESLEQVMRGEEPGGAGDDEDGEDGEDDDEDKDDDE